MTPATKASADASDPRWKGRKVLVAVTGGIACFKAASLVSRLAQSGATVRVIMTDAAIRFVTPLTFEALSGQSVVTSVWQSSVGNDVAHIELAQWPDLVIVTPATADCIARIAAGQCDDLVTLCLCALPRRTPVLVAPAMNEQMWQNPVTRRNVDTCRQLLGCHTVGPGEGWQACRTRGAGRMSEPEEILAAAATLPAKR